MATSQQRMLLAQTNAAKTIHILAQPRLAPPKTKHPTASATEHLGTTDIIRRGYYSSEGNPDATTSAVGDSSRPAGRPHSTAEDAKAGGTKSGVSTAEASSTARTVLAYDESTESAGVLAPAPAPPAFDTGTAKDVDFDAFAALPTPARSPPSVGLFRKPGVFKIARDRARFPPPLEPLIPTPSAAPTAELLTSGFPPPEVSWLCRCRRPGMTHRCCGVSRCADSNPMASLPAEDNLRKSIDWGRPDFPPALLPPPPPPPPPTPKPSALSGKPKLPPSETGRGQEGLPPPPEALLLLFMAIRTALPLPCIKHW